VSLCLATIASFGGSPTSMFYPKSNIIRKSYRKLGYFLPRLEFIELSLHCSSGSVCSIWEDVTTLYVADI
jgi:hypothetical protein